MNNTLLAILVVAASLALTTPARQNARQDVSTYLTRAGLASSDVSRLDTGAVVTHVTNGQSPNELFVVAAVKIRAPRQRVTDFYGQMIAYVDGSVTLAFGRFGSPPSIADVKDLAFDRRDVDDMKSCRPGRCDVRLGGAGLDKLRSAIDWSATDYVERVNAFARKAAVDYVAAYQSRGDAALFTYNDRAEAVSLKEQWLGILGNSPLFHQYTPELKTYLEQFPRGSLPGVRNVFYWSNEDYGFKPVINIVHGVIYAPTAQSDRTIVVQKQLYASHYLDGSLAVATLLDTEDSGRPATYLLYANRLRGDMLKGGFGGLKRNAALSQARKAAEQTLGTIKQAVEAAVPHASISLNTGAIYWIRKMNPVDEEELPDDHRGPRQLGLT